MKNKPFGFKTGIGLTILGDILIIVNIVMLQTNDSFFPKMLIAGCALSALGMSMIAVPGVTPPDDTPDNKKAGAWWKGSSPANKIVWIIASGAGMAAGFYWAFAINLDFI